MFGVPPRTLVQNLALALAGAATLSACATTESRASFASSDSPYPPASASSPEAREASPWQPVAAALAADDSRVDIRISHSDLEFDEIEFDGDLGAPTKAMVDRERTEVRFAFGGEPSRGVFKIFTEEWGTSPESIDVYGLGGGMVGAPTVGDNSGEVDLIVPYRWDLNVAAGKENDFAGGTDDAELVFGEFFADLGFGIDWRGLRPSVGVEASVLRGTINSDVLADPDIDGFNVGFFAELRYKHPEVALYGVFRQHFGDIDGSEFGLGFGF